MYRLAFVLLVACGGGQKAASTMPEAKADDGPTCAAVSGHVVDLLAAKQPDAPPDMVKKISDTLTKHCEQDQWSAASRQCFAKMASPQDGDACEDGLTPAQKKSLEAEDAAPDGGATKTNAAPPPPGGSRGTPKKGGDPCDGSD